MKHAAFAAVPLFCCLAAAAGSSAASQGHPIEKVIGLLQELSEKVKSEGQAEEVTYSKFEHWCANSITSLEQAVTKEKEDIEVMGLKIDSLKSQKKTLEDEVAMLTEELAKAQAAGQGAKELRDEAAALYEAADKDLESSIKAIADAIAALEAAKTSTSAASLAQTRIQAVAQLPLVLSELTAAQRALLAADPKEEILAKGAAAAHEKKYSFKSGSVIDLLKELKLKFEDDRVAATKAETNAQNEYDLAKNAREAAVKAAVDAKTEKETVLGTVKEDLASTESTLKDTKQDLEADSKSLEDVQKSCTMKKEEWAERTDIRDREMKAMDAAIKILAKVSGVRTEAPSNPTLPPSPVQGSEMMLLQVVDPSGRAINLLRETARKVHSRSFARFAEEVAAKVGGPFDKINSMIEKMIFQLMAEQKDEDDHKNWCDLEITKTNTSRTNKEEKITSLNAKITDGKATIDLLTSEITDASEMVAKLTAHIQEATEIRNVGKEENKVAIKDAQDAQAAIAQAEAVLLDFYKSSGEVPKEAWELVQRGVDLPEQPSTWDSSYTGVANPESQPDGIITVLKAVSADFASMEADTKAQESTDENAYQEEMKSSEIEKARRAKEAEIKEQEKSRLVDKVDAYQKSLKHTTDELEAVEQYYKDLGPACIEGDSTYDDRKAARAAEIEALKQAQVILADYESRDAAPAPAPPATAFLSAVKPVRFLAPARTG